MAASAGSECHDTTNSRDGRVLVLATGNLFVSPGGGGDLPQDLPPLEMAHLVTMLTTLAGKILP